MSIRSLVRTFVCVSIDPESYTPAYVQLADLLRGQIDSGELRPGQPLPSEAALVAEHGLARESVRRAVALLRQEGSVYTVPGRGSYIRGQENVSVIRLSKPARVSSRMPTAQERRHHSIPEGVPVFVIDRDTDTHGEILPADRTVIEVDDSTAGSPSSPEV